MQTVLPAPVAELKRAFDSLSQEHKDVFAQVLAQSSTSEDDSEIPPWHLEILEERQRLADEGKNPTAPMEEAFARIRQRLAELRARRGS